MIHRALALLASELESYFIAKYGNKEYVALGNVAHVDSENQQGMDRKIVMSVVNLEEESTLKNLPQQIKTVNGGVRYEKPPVYLNLYLLFSANFPPNSDSYFTSLQYISTVIEFFQGKYVFNLQNSPSFGNLTSAEDVDFADVHLILNMYTLTFEQINHLWGSLGGKQMASVLYKVRLVRMVDRRATGFGSLIEEINNNSVANVP